MSKILEASKCPNCGESLVYGASFCNSCGVKIEEELKQFYPECGKQIIGNMRFCPFCGSYLKDGQNKKMDSDIRESIVNNIRKSDNESIDVEKAQDTIINKKTIDEKIQNFQDEQNRKKSLKKKE